MGGKKKVKLYLGRSFKAKIRKTQARLATGKLSKKTIRDSALKQLWSPKQRAATQLEQLGIAYDPNKCLSKETLNNTQSELVQYYEQLSKQQVPRQPKHLTRSEKLYLSNLYQKYGTDFKRAFRDRKLNYLQWTVCLCHIDVYLLSVLNKIFQETQLAKKYSKWINENNSTENIEK